MYVEWMPHFWCGVMKLSTTSGLPFERLPSMGATVLVSTGGR